jgi:hypothetical protein
MNLAVIYCAVLEDEIEVLAQAIPEVVHLEKLPQGLHNDPPLLRTETQAAIDRCEADARIDTLVLGYGLCSRGTEGVKARRCTLVMPRAHDCITLLLGSKEQYAQYVAKHPGTYWYSPGWNRHHIPPGKRRYDHLRDQYVRQYGEDNADFLMEEEQHWFKTYDRATFVDQGSQTADQDAAYAAECADWLGWNFDRIQGDSSLLRRMLSGDWRDDEVLVLEPHETFALSPDAQVITRVHVPGTAVLGDDPS